jgi:hypothetical protein
MMLTSYIIFCRGRPDPSQWPSRVVLPEDGKISVNSEDLAKVIVSELLPNQQYFLKVQVHVRQGQDIDEVRRRRHLPCFGTDFRLLLTCCRP